MGLVIGKGGEAIKSMQAKSEARIQVYYLVLQHYLQSEIRFHWIYLLVVFSCFTQGLFGRKNCSIQAQVLGCSVCNGGHELQFRSFILAKYVTCVGHLYAYTEMIYCSRYGMFSRITSVSLEPNLLYWDQHHGFPCLVYVLKVFFGLHEYQRARKYHASAHALCIGMKLFLAPLSNAQA